MKCPHCQCETNRPDAIKVLRGEFRISPQQARMLILLAESSPQPVEKTEVHRQISKGKYDDGVHIRVIANQLREAFRHGRTGIHIDTVHSVGYVMPKHSADRVLGLIAA